MLLKTNYKPRIHTNQNKLAEKALFEESINDLLKTGMQLNSAADVQSEHLFAREMLSKIDMPTVRYIMVNFSGGTFDRNWLQVYLEDRRFREVVREGLHQPHQIEKGYQRQFNRIFERSHESHSINSRQSSEDRLDDYRELAHSLERHVSEMHADSSRNENRPESGRNKRRMSAGLKSIASPKAD